MENKQLEGPWVKEQHLLLDYQEQLGVIKGDIAKHYTPELLNDLQDKDLKLRQLEQRIKMTNSQAFFNANTVQLNQDIAELRQELAEMQKKIRAAEIKGEAEANRQIQAIEEIDNSYKAMNYYESLSAKIPRSLGFNLWYQAEKKSEYLRYIEQIAHRAHNSLAQLFLTTDTDFIELIDAQQIVFEGEIGLLMIQRLQNIYANKASKKSMLSTAGKTIHRFMSSELPESLLFFNQESLIVEITKLALHAEFHPEHKIAWLGTAKAVEACIHATRPMSIYFNPPRQHLNWALNRLWLNSALHLGYQFQLVEQHFPKIEQAILSQDPVKFLEQLILETRPNTQKLSSQYNGQYSPTATTQEVLALMDMGCKAYKNAEGKMMLNFENQEEPLALTRSSTHLFPSMFMKSAVKRSHSCPVAPATSPPPYENWTELFIWHKEAPF